MLVVAFQEDVARTIFTGTRCCVTTVEQPRTSRTTSVTRLDTITPWSSGERRDYMLQPLPLEGASCLRMSAAGH